MLEKKTKIVWVVCLFILSEIMAYWGYKDFLILSKGQPMEFVFGISLIPLTGGSILAFIYSAINKFNKEKASSVYCVWTAGIVVISIITWPATAKLLEASKSLF